MTLDLLFALTTYSSIGGWVLLVFLPRSALVTTRLAPIILPIFLGVAYTALMVVAWPDRQGGFGNLDAVAALFGDRRILLAGWIHYLAFDLFVGAWLTRDAVRVGLPRWVLVPCQVSTFWAGPFGWLLYVVCRRWIGGPIPREAHHVG